MQRMMPSVESVSRIALIAFALCAVAVVAAPYQELAPRKGYVPVYIRVGETPLSEIHPALAEAFHELESSSLTAKKDKPDTLATPADGTASIASDNVEETPAAVEPIAVAASSANGESDIASFDVVKGAAEETFAEKATEASAAA